MPRDFFNLDVFIVMITGIAGLLAHTNATAATQLTPLTGNPPIPLSPPSPSLYLVPLGTSSSSTSPSISSTTTPGGASSAAGTSSTLSASSSSSSTSSVSASVSTPSTLTTFHPDRENLRSIERALTRLTADPNGLYMIPGNTPSASPYSIRSVVYTGDTTPQDAPLTASLQELFTGPDAKHIAALQLKNGSQRYYHGVSVLALRSAFSAFNCVGSPLTPREAPYICIETDVQCSLSGDPPTFRWRTSYQATPTSPIIPHGVAGQASVTHCRGSRQLPQATTGLQVFSSYFVPLWLHSARHQRFGRNNDPAVYVIDTASGSVGSLMFDGTNERGTLTHYEFQPLDRSTPIRDIARTEPPTRRVFWSIQRYHIDRLPLASAEDKHAQSVMQSLSIECAAYNVNTGRGVVCSPRLGLYHIVRVNDDGSYDISGRRHYLVPIRCPLTEHEFIAIEVSREVDDLSGIPAKILDRSSWLSTASKLPISSQLYQLLYISAAAQPWALAQAWRRADDLQRRQALAEQKRQVEAQMADDQKRRAEEILQVQQELTTIQRKLSEVESQKLAAETATSSNTATYEATIADLAKINREQSQKLEADRKALTAAKKQAVEAQTAAEKAQTENTQLREASNQAVSARDAAREESLQREEQLRDLRTELERLRTQRDQLQTESLSAAAAQERQQRQGQVQPAQQRRPVAMATPWYYRRSTLYGAAAIGATALFGGGLYWWLYSSRPGTRAYYSLPPRSWEAPSSSSWLSRAFSFLRPRSQLP